MIRRPPRSTQSRSSAASDVYKRQLVLRLEVDHGLTAVTALTMHVLEQMQGQRTGMIEQEHVTLLQIIKIVGGEFRQQAVQLIAHAERSVSYTHLTLPTIYSV